MPVPSAPSINESSAADLAVSIGESRRPHLCCAFCFGTILPDETLVTFTPDINGSVHDLHFHQSKDRECWGDYQKQVLRPRTEWVDA